MRFCVLESLGAAMLCLLRFLICAIIDTQNHVGKLKQNVLTTNNSNKKKQFFINLYKLRLYTCTNFN